MISGGLSSLIIYLLHKSEKSLIFLVFSSSWTPFLHPILEFHSSVAGPGMGKQALRWPCWDRDWHGGLPRCSGAEHQSPVIREHRTAAGSPAYTSWRIQMEISAPTSFFQLHPRWCFSFFCLIFLFRLPVTVEMCKTRNLDGRWAISVGIVHCVVGVGLPGWGVSQGQGHPIYWDAASAAE